MTSISAKQAAALRTLVGLWPEERVVLVGAAAISCFLELRRMTLDIDLSVSLSIENYERDLRRQPGWSSDASREGSWMAPGGVRVDIVPASPGLLARGHVVWPRSRRTMSLTGIRLALLHAIALNVRPDILLRVAPLQVLAVLKMAAYVDRPAERDKDLGDIAMIMEGYADDERRFSDVVLDLGLSYADVSPHLLGADLARLIDGRERQVIEEFLAMARDDDDPNATLARMARAAPPEYRNPAQLMDRLTAFERALTARSR